MKKVLSLALLAILMTDANAFVFGDPNSCIELEKEIQDDAAKAPVISAIGTKAQILAFLDMAKNNHIIYGELCCADRQCIAENKNIVVNIEAAIKRVKRNYK